MKPKGRPATLNFKETARVDFKLEAETKRNAIDKVVPLGHKDLSAFLRHCCVLAASGEAAAIPQLHGANGVAQGLQTGKP